MTGTKDRTKHGLRRGTAIWMAPLLALTLGLTACGDDEEGATTATTVDQAAQQRRAYCDKSLQLETVAPPEGGPEEQDLSPEQERAQVRQFANEKIIPLVNEIQPLIPPEIRTDGELLVAKAREVAQSGDISVFEQPEVRAAEKRAHAYDLQNCGWKRVDVTGIEYAFQGIPQTLPAGPTSFELVNKGREPHELIVLRVKDGVTDSFQQIVQQQARDKVEILGSVEETKAGDSNHGVANLRPGRYGVVCFIPVGGRGSGPPHAARGMLAEFTVS